MGSIVFVAVTFETVPVGLLSAMAGGLGTDEQGAGLLISGYSSVVVLGAIPLSAAAARFDARRVLVVVLAVFVVGSLGLAVAHWLPVALTARVLSGAAHCVVYTAVYRIALVAVPHGRQAVAATTVSIGNAAALSLGVPAATALGAADSWRTPFVALTGCFVVLAVLTIVLVRPSARSEPATTARETLRATTQRPLVAVGAVVAGLVAAHFLSFTYVEPILRGAGVPAEAVSAVLLGTGVAGVLGVIAVSPFAGRRPITALRVGGLAMVASLLGAWLSSADAVGTVVGLVVWGFAFGAVQVLFQVLALRAAGDAVQAAPALVSVSINVGITVGASIGGFAVSRLEPAILCLLSAGGVAAVLIVASLRRSPRRSSDDVDSEEPG